VAQFASIEAMLRGFDKDVNQSVRLSPTMVATLCGQKVEKKIGSP